MNKAKSHLKLVPLSTQLYGWILGFLIFVLYKEYVADEYFGNYKDLMISALVLFFIFYINILWLLPRFIKGKRLVFFKLVAFIFVEIFALIVLLILLSIFVGGAELNLKGMPNKIFILNFFSFLLPFLNGMVLSAAIYGVLNSMGRKVSELKMENIKWMNEAQANHQSWLKAQLNPHFLNNTFSMLRYLNVHSPKLANEALAVVNDMMNYYLESTKKGLIPLKDEIEQVKSLITFNQIRLIEKVSLKLLVSGDLTHVKIPPMLVLLLVENIFKYGVLDDPDFPAKLRIAMENNILSIRTENKINNMKSEVSTGIGLQNLKERLDHFYPDKHSFKAEAKGDVFVVALELEVEN